MRLLDALGLRRCRLRKFEERLRQGIDKFVELVVQVMERADLREVVQALYCLVQNLNFRFSESTSCSKGLTNCFHAHRAVATARCSPAGGKIQKGQRGNARYCAGLKGQGCRFCKNGGDLTFLSSVVSNTTEKAAMMRSQDTRNISRP